MLALRSTESMNKRSDEEGGEKAEETEALSPSPCRPSADCRGAENRDAQETSADEPEWSRDG